MEPIDYRLQKAITRFVMDHPGVNPRNLLLDDPTIIEVLDWMKNGGANTASMTGIAPNGDMIVYGLTIAKAPPNSGIIVLGVSRP